MLIILNRLCFLYKVKLIHQSYIKCLNLVNELYLLLFFFKNIYKSYPLNQFF